MVMPLLSVTAIGVIVGMVAGAATGKIGRRSIEGVVAAWLGFLAGAILGILFDILAGTGSMVAWLGHAAALAGAVATFTVGPFRPRTSV
ncbi:MAG TPA: hypothetical protein VLA91_05345 [Acidimicrobiia bacterium]|nr:hypothetical protein [Acidimicrobiia bacterium]